MKRIVLCVLVALLAAAGTSVAENPPADGIPRMTREQLRAELGNPHVVIVDVRRSVGWNRSISKIRGAVQEDPAKVGAWIDKYPKDKTYVFYCTCHNEATSARVAKEFISRGYKKVHALLGGWDAWKSAGYPTEPVPKTGRSPGPDKAHRRGPFLPSPP